MRQMARGLAQHGGLPCWLEESDPAGLSLMLYIMVGPCCTVPPALAAAAQLRADGISSCCYIVNVHKWQAGVGSPW